MGSSPIGEQAESLYFTSVYTPYSVNFARAISAVAEKSFSSFEISDAASSKSAFSCADTTN